MARSELYDILQDIDRRKVSYADIRSDLSSGFEIRMENKEIKTLKGINELGLGLRVLVDGTWGFTTATSVESLKRNIPQVISLAENSAKSNTKKIEIETAEGLDQKTRWKPKRDLSQVSVDEKIDFISEANKRPFSLSKRIIAVNSRYSEQEQIHQFVNTEERLLEYSFSRVLVSQRFVGKS